MPKPEFIKVPGAPSPRGPFSHAVRAGDFLFISGQAPGNLRDDRTYTVHHPGLHVPHIRKEKAARAIASHAYNDLAGNGYCFDCGLEETHPESKHSEIAHADAAR